MENIVLKASDGYALSLAVFESEHPRGYIQIIHGMEEHKERYEAFAEQLRLHIRIPILRNRFPVSVNQKLTCHSSKAGVL